LWENGQDSLVGGPRAVARVRRVQDFVCEVRCRDYPHPASNQGGERERCGAAPGFAEQCGHRPSLEGDRLLRRVPHTRACEPSRRGRWRGHVVSASARAREPRTRQGQSRLEAEGGCGGQRQVSDDDQGTRSLTQHAVAAEITIANTAVTAPSGSETPADCTPFHVTSLKSKQA